MNMSEQGSVNDILGAAFFSNACRCEANLITWSGGLAQKTKQFLGSMKPGSRLRSSSRSRKGSMRTSLKSDEVNFSLC